MLLDFFSSPAGQFGESRLTQPRIFEIHPPLAEETERAILRCAEVAAYRVAAAGDEDYALLILMLDCNH